ncbi:hypothetical protein A5779_20780 [Mycolicibacterium peregrinum]|uniref:Uncharacterized protein n=1 Tax=Mycolicibacterium peregrinum TaxID=43304 RepID=A0A1A0WAE7_MYCPR|nr:hypothetical protein A5779_20780 [Mycolicibacterium peregrinum]
MPTAFLALDHGECKVARGPLQVLAFARRETKQAVGLALADFYLRAVPDAVWQPLGRKRRKSTPKVTGLRCFPALRWPDAVAEF